MASFRCHPAAYVLFFIGFALWLGEIWVAVFYTATS